MSKVVMEYEECLRGMPFYNSFISLRTPIGLSAIFLFPLPAPHDVPAVVPAISRHLRNQVRTRTNPLRYSDHL
jgi:hypothetical protein